MDRAQRRLTVDRLRHVLLDVDREQECPADVPVVVRRLQRVERYAGQSRVVVHHVRITVLVGAVRVALYQRCVHTRRGEVYDVELVRELCDDLGALVVKVAEDEVLRNGLAVHDAGRAVLPVLTLLPDRPLAGRVVAVQHVRSRSDGWIVLEGQRVFGISPHVLRHDPDASPAVEEVGVEARVRSREFEDDRVIVLGVDVVDVLGHDRVAVEAFDFLEQVHREHHVVGGERLAV